MTVREPKAGATTGAVFTVSLSTPSAFTVSVVVATADVTATAGKDYVAVPSTTLTFAPGETSKKVTVTILGDKQTEPAELFAVLLTRAMNARLRQPFGIGTILDSK